MADFITGIYLEDKDFVSPKNISLLRKISRGRYCPADEQLLISLIFLPFFPFSPGCKWLSSMESPLVFPYMYYYHSKPAECKILSPVLYSVCHST